MRFKFNSFALATILLLLSMWSRATEQLSERKPAQKFEFELSAAAARKLESGVAQLRKGASVDLVKRLLGKPDSERTLYTKQFFGGGKFTAKVLTYSIKRVHTADDNLNDQVINLYFDQNDRLTGAERLGYSITGSYELIEGVQIREKIL